MPAVIHSPNQQPHSCFSVLCIIKAHYVRHHTCVEGIMHIKVTSQTDYISGRSVNFERSRKHLNLAKICGMFHASGIIQHVEKRSEGGNAKSALHLTHLSRQFNKLLVENNMHKIIPSYFNAHSPHRFLCKRL